MAIDWGKVRQAMTSDQAYRGTGVAKSRVPEGLRANQRLGFRPISRQPGIAAANVRPRDTGGIWNTAKAKARQFVPPALEMMGRVGDLASGAMRGSRLHKAFKDKYGGSGEWKAAKASMMTGAGLKKGDPGYEDSDQAFYDKYMNLADMAQDNQKAQEYRDIAETAWRNKQTSDRLAAYTGFEDYLPSKYTGEGEGARYTGSHRKAGQFVPGVDIMRDIAARLRGPDLPGETIGAAGGPIPDPDMDITSDLYGMYPGPEDDLLYGEPGTESFRPEIKEKPLPGEFYEYPDEKWGAPINYNTYRDEDYGAPLSGFRKSPGSFMFPGNLFGFLDKESYGPMPGAELPYEMYEDEEINPDMLDPAYWDQFTPG